MAWTGSHHKGAMREHRKRKRAEAEARNVTASDWRARARLTIPLPDPCGKPAYTKRDATAAAKHRSKALGRPIYIYRCDTCPGWHLTKKERDAASN